MSERPRSGDLVFWAVCSLTLLASRAIASIVFPVYDDAFITFRFARHLAEGLGFVYQAGERVLGTTSPLFGLICALPHLAGLPMPATIVVANVLVDLFVLWLAIRHFPRELRRELGIPFALLFAMSPILSRVCVGGMEVNLFLAASLVAIELDRRGRAAPAIATAALCCFLRPEGVLLLLLLLYRVSRRAPVRDQLRSLVAAVAVLVPPLVLLTLYFGSPLPQSMRAKTVLLEHRPGVGTVLETFLAYDPLMTACLLFAVVGCVRVARDPRFEFQRTVALWAAGYLAAYALARPKIWSWYGEPVYFAEVLLAAVGVQWLWSHWSPRFALSAGLRRLAPLLPLASLVFWAALFAREGPSGVTRHVFRPLEAWARSHRAAEATYLASDIGVLGYYTDARIYDLAGLVWPPALRLHTQENVIAAYHPDYLFVNLNQHALEVMARAPWKDAYVPVERFSMEGRTEIPPTRVAPGDAWTQDYLLLERRDRRR